MPTDRPEVVSGGIAGRNPDPLHFQVFLRTSGAHGKKPNQRKPKDNKNDFNPQNQTIMDYKKITSFEAACSHLGISEELPDVSNAPEDIQKCTTAYYKLVLICRAINNGWKPDFTNWNQKKWFPWFRINDDGASSGFGYSISACSPAYAASNLGSRLCFESEEKAEYVGKTFIDLYNDYLHNSIN
jgi:hypothetical protein